MGHSKPAKSSNEQVLREGNQVVSPFGVPVFEVSVEGDYSIVVDYLSELLKSAAEKATATKVELNRRVCCRVLSVYNGNSVNRWITFNIFGRPLIEVGVQFFQDDEIIANFTLTRSAFFVARNDLLHKVSRGVKARALLATTCRKSARVIVQRASHHFAISKKETRRLMNSLRDEPMIIFLFGGAVFMWLITGVASLGKQVDIGMIVAGMIGSGMFGVLLGFLVGRIFNGIRGLFNRK
ncbi:MAG: hypothetical protein ACI9G1_003445 [Pirellulaceae bacterium]|jgi:hypothetical protein